MVRVLISDVYREGYKIVFFGAHELGTLMDGYSIVESTAINAWQAVRSIFENPERKSCAGGVKIPGTGLCVYLGVSRTAAVAQYYNGANLYGEFCVIFRMCAPHGEIVLSEPSDRQFFTAGEWGPIIFEIHNPSAIGVTYAISYEGGEQIEVIAAKHPESFAELIADLRKSSLADGDWYA